MKRGRQPDAARRGEPVAQLYRSQRIEPDLLELCRRARPRSAHGPARRSPRHGQGPAAPPRAPRRSDRPAGPQARGLGRPALTVRRPAAAAARAAAGGTPSRPGRASTARSSWLPGSAPHCRRELRRKCQTLVGRRAANQPPRDIRAESTSSRWLVMTGLSAQMPQAIEVPGGPGRRRSRRARRGTSFGRRVVACAGPPRSRDGGEAARTRPGRRRG